MAAHQIPYQATASIAYPEDLYKKLNKAKEIRGFKFIHIYRALPDGLEEPGPRTRSSWPAWPSRTASSPSTKWRTANTLQTMKTANRKPVLEYLKLQGRFKHLKENDVADIQKMVDTRYAELEKRFQG